MKADSGLREYDVSFDTDTSEVMLYFGRVIK